MSYLEVWVVEAVLYIPAQHEEFSPLQQHAVEEAQSEEEFLVLVLFVAAAELLFRDQLVQTFHVGFQSLYTKTKTW